MRQSGNHPLRIGMIVNLFHPVVGGAERQAQQLASKLINSGLEVDIITRKHPDCTSFELIDNIPLYRILSYYDLTGHPLVAPIRRLRKKVARCERISASENIQPKFQQGVNGNWKTRLVEAYSHLGIRIPLWRHALFHKYDILHLNLLSTFKMLRDFPGRFKECRKVLKLGAIADFEELRKSGKVDFFRDRINQDFDRLICVSSEMRRQCLALGILPEKLIDIPNAVDTDRYKPPVGDDRVLARKRLGMNNKFMILSIGSQQEVKGLDVLLHAVARARGRIPCVCHVHLGREGNATPQLKRIIEEGGLQELISFPGEVDDVRPYLHAADVFVLSSLAEGLSNALLEAMSSGLPVVATDVSGSQDLVRTDDTGVLVPPGDVPSLARAIEFLYKNEDLRNHCAQRARKAIQDRYSLDAITQIYIEFYKSMNTS
jgi:glycosyltransferase involved in cell wall biosynthesis